MKVFCDLHLHSKYSRACSKNISLDSLAANARKKGLTVLGTGDFSFHAWNKELKSKLSESDGIYEYDGIKFVLSNEISLMYTQDGKKRRIHHILLAPSFDVVDQINEFLAKKGRLDYDGRPIFGFSSIELVDAMISISKDIMIIPAHAWTPWFGVFGSMSGFDSLDECFQERTKHIYAIETGLSSDPSMNWRVSSLDNIALVSFSDAHSANTFRLGRECTVLDLDKLDYFKLTDAIKNKKIHMTIEFFPEEGKYHYDGHRTCNFSCGPSEAEKLNNICPKCKSPLTIGVLHRVEAMANRPEGYRPKGAADFRSVLPLSELIALYCRQAVFSKKVFSVYNSLIDKFDSEFNVLLDAKKDELEKTDAKLADLIIKNREGKIEIVPGYDGVYGKPLLPGRAERRQKSVSDF